MQTPVSQGQGGDPFEATSQNTGGASDLIQAFGVVSIPATYLIDPQGTIIRIDLRGKALDETLGRLMKRPAATTGAR